MTTLMVKPGVKLPPIARRTNAKTVRKYPFDTLEVGQMCFVPGKTAKKFTTYVSSEGRRMGRKFTTRTTTMRQDLETSEWEPCTASAPGAKTGVLVCRTA